MKEETNMLNGCCFTGHRNIPEDVVEPLRARLMATIADLHRERGITTFYAGGCTGFDTLAAQMVLEYRSEHPEVSLIIVVPHREQSRSWSLDEQVEYQRILEAATEIVCLAEHYFNGCMARRNRYTVDRSVVCVSYQTKEKGGTASTVKYAKKKGLTIYNLVKNIIWTNEQTSI